MERWGGGLCVYVCGVIEGGCDMLMEGGGGLWVYVCRVVEMGWDMLMEGGGGDYQLPKTELCTFSCVMFSNL